MKVQYKVISLGFNELGVKEFNEFYKENIENLFIEPIKVGDLIITKEKIFKQTKSFLDLKEDNFIGSYGIMSCTPRLGYFQLKLKHLNYRIVKLEIIEKESEFVF